MLKSCSDHNSIFRTRNFQNEPPKISATRYHVWYSFLTPSLDHIPYQLSTTVDVQPNMMIMKFILTNESIGVEKEAQLLIDDGCMKELIIPAREAKRLGLQPSPNIYAFSISGVGGTKQALTMTPALLVSCNLVSQNGTTVEQKRDLLVATVFLDAWVEVEKDETVVVGRSDLFHTKTPPPEKKKKSGPLLYTELSPVKHKPDPESLLPKYSSHLIPDEAIIGKPGLAKLQLFVAPNQNRVYMFCDDK